jgi:hypothetical protein
MFLLPETVARQDGMGAETPVDIKIVQLTLGITRIIAQESLEVSIWGSADCLEWRFLVSFPQKFYCGTYPMVLDLTRHRDVRYLRVQWKMGRWIRDESAPLFGFYLSAGELRDVAANAGR